MEAKDKMNRRMKGRRAEKELQTLLEDAGWEVLLVDSPKKWKLDQDFHNLFDIIARKGKWIKYIQVKCNRMIGPKDRKKYIDWGNKYPNPYQTIEVWVRKDGLPKNKRWNAHILWCMEEK